MNDGAGESSVRLAEQLTRFEDATARRHVRLGNLDWSYRVGGAHEGEAVVFLPGGAGSARAWFDQARRLLSRYRVVLIDLPISASANELADGISSVLKAEALSPVHLVGTSLGGMLGELSSRATPDAIRSLFLASTGLYGPEDAPTLRRGLRFTKLLPGVLLRAGARARLRGLLADSPAPQFWLELVTEPYAGRAVRARLANQQRLLLGLVEHVDELMALSSWSGLLTVLRAADDNLMTPKMTGRLVAAHHECQLVHEPTGGHLLAQTRPDAFAAALSQHLERAP